MDRSVYPVVEGLDVGTVPSPAYVLDLGALRRNLERLADIKRQAGCRFLLSQSAFAMYGVYPMIRWYLDGASANSLHEARLGHEEMGGEVHAVAPAYSEADVEALLPLCRTIVFNSFSQWERFRPRLQASPNPPSPGLRVNPEFSEIEHEVINTNLHGSRFGMRPRDLERRKLDGIEGFYVHVPCELSAAALERLLGLVEEKFGPHLARLRWLNFGNGHPFTAEDYDVDRFRRALTAFRQRHPETTLYFEPGTAVVAEAGVLVATVLDIVEADTPIAILDTSAAAHMPEVLGMPYRPPVAGADFPRRKSWTCRVTGVSCQAGDVIGEYSFDAPLGVGDRLVFLDMAHHTMVKNNTFCGIRLPAIATWDPTKKTLRLVHAFDYADFKTRLS